MPPSGVDYASEFLNGYAPEYVYNTMDFNQITMLKSLIRLDHLFISPAVK